jgi:hypothetical protein
MQAAMNLFALAAVSAANLHAPISFGFAFVSAISPVDEAFDGKPLDDRPDSWLVDAAVFAATSATLTITADLEIPKGGASGAILSQGGRFGGWSLYLKDGKPAYTYNFLGLKRTTIAGKQPVPAGRATVTMAFAYDGGGVGNPCVYDEG